MYALQNPAPQAPFSNIGESQLVAIETLSKIFTKASDYGKSTKDPPMQADHTAAGSIPQTPYPGRPDYMQYTRYPSTARGSSLAVNDRTQDVRVTSDRPSTP